MEKNALHLAVTMSQLKRLQSTHNDIKTFAKTDRGCLAWYTLVYLLYVMCLICTSPNNYDSTFVPKNPATDVHYFSWSLCLQGWLTQWQRNSSGFLQISLWNLSWYPNTPEHIVLMVVGSPSPLFLEGTERFHIFVFTFWSLLPTTFNHPYPHCFLQYCCTHTLNILECYPSKALCFYVIPGKTNHFGTLNFMLHLNHISAS